MGERTVDGRPRRPVAGLAVAAAALLLAAPSPLQALDDLRSPSSAADPTEPLVSALALLAWLLAGWLLLTVLLTLAGRLPGLAGLACTAVTRRIAPATVRRAVEVALGLTVAAGVLGASPASAAGTGPAAPPAAAVAASLDWTAPAPPASDLDWPAPAASAPAPAAQQAVVVRPGDTLWDLAERSLRAAGDAEPTDREVARAWPAWWAANRDAVGDDPDLLRPGTSLAPPAAGGAGPSSP